LLQALKLDNSLADAHLRISQIYRYMKKDKLADKHQKQAERLGIKIHKEMSNH
jgi:Tfp pilus assembly protein PilF